MPRQRWYWVGLVSTLAPIAAMLITCFLLTPETRTGGLLTASFGCLGLVSLWPFWIASRERDVGPDQLEREQREFERACQAAETELRKQTEILEKRERQLADRFLHHLAWMEYPLEGYEAASEASPTASAAENEPVDTPAAAIQRGLDSAGDHASDAQANTTSYDELDRRVAEVLQEKSEELFEKIKANQYAPNGIFNLDLLRDDLLAVISDVARVYNPDSENPLLETSVEQLLRAGSRICLHILVLMERLPVNIGTYNLQSLHGYLRQALKAYKVYQAVQPFVPYVQYASYAGRMLLGSNPVTLGAQWALWKLGSKGATEATKRLVNRQALGFVHDSITIVGYEVAGIYGGDFRHRDRHWIYAAELTDLTERFPLTREILLSVFAELGSLPMRSEYDRVFLYRCVAAHRSAHPERYESIKTLSANDRKWVVIRLEKFFERFLCDQDEAAKLAWQEELQHRIGIKPVINRQRQSQSSRSIARDITRSLALMLTTERQVDLEDVPRYLSHSIAGRQLQQSDIAEICQTLADEHPGGFEVPDVDPESDWVDVLLTDLATMTALTLSNMPFSASSLEWSADFFRVDAKRVEKTIEQAIRTSFEQRLSATAPSMKLPTEAMSAALELIPENSLLEFVYAKVAIQLEGNEETEDFGGRLLLVGSPKALQLIDYADPLSVLWQFDATADSTTEKRLLQTTTVITGGNWSDGESRFSAIRISRTAATGQDAYFEPITRVIRQLRDRSAN